LSPQQLKAVAVVVISLSLLISLYGFFSARNIQVEEVVIPVDNMPDGISEFSIVQLSDIHAGAINGPDFVRKNVEIANSLNPDVVVITGDLFDGSSAHSEEKLKHLVEPIKDLRSRFGSFFITGNHEKYVGADLTSGIVASLNVTPLRNSLTRVNGITLIGIDNPVSEMRKGIPELSELNIPKDAPSVLLYHVPVGIDDAVRHGISLQLSGHTHGGQIFPFGLFEKLVYKAVSGLYTQGSFTLYVSRGSGTWGPPMRVFAPPEITRITLTGK
ncbi:metallophosphoesterase, partial [Candidatus Woesearchaeota archaeon]